MKVIHIVLSLFEGRIIIDSMPKTVMVMYRLDEEKE